MNDYIFGHTWGEIQAAQQGGRLNKPVVMQAPKTATEQDIELLKEHGLAGLTDKGFFGTIDRLKQAGLI
jgi:hypothetical protein